MDLSKNTIKKIIGIIFLSILFKALIENIDIVRDFFVYTFNVFTPFIIGGVIAFIFNVPMKKIEKLLSKKNIKKARRLLAFIITAALGVVVMITAFLVIVPEITNTIQQIAVIIPNKVMLLEEKYNELSPKLPKLKEYIDEINLNWGDIALQASSYLKNWGNDLLDSSFNIIGSIISGITTFVIGFIFSIYVLFEQEKLILQAKKVIYAFLPKKAADKIVYIAQLSDRIFSNFLSGQCIEALILGLMFFVAMLIFRLPYALFVGVLISITALIPVVGTLIGCIVSFLLIVMVNPWEALGFLVLFIVIQQIDGNLIYPKVVGNSVGLPPIYVLVAVTVGGSLMGVIGMLIFIPLCSVCYVLIKEIVKTRLKERKINENSL